MTKFKNPVITVAVLAGLLFIGSLMDSRQPVAHAAGGPTVTIDPAQLPLPVEAAQKGPWNVGILGSPTVNFSNSASNPLLVRDVDNPARAPFQTTLCTSLNLAVNPCNQPYYLAVPPNRRLIIEFIAAQCVSGTTAQPNLETTVGGTTTDFFFPNSGVFAQTRIYADPGSTVYFQFGASGPAVDICTLQMSGYTVAP